MLAGHAEQALYDWLKAHAPAHVFAVFTGAALLRLMAAHPTDNSIASPAEIDETVIDVLKGMVAMGAAFGDGITTWRAALDEVQP